DQQANSKNVRLTCNYKMIVDELEKSIPRDQKQRPEVLGVIRIIEIMESFQEHDNTSTTKESDAVIITQNEMRKCNTVTDLNHLFIISKQFVNKHLNPTWDYFLGISNTYRWQQVAQEIRNNAYAKLFAAVNAISERAFKIQHLEDAKQFPVFKEHRS